MEAEAEAEADALDVVPEAALAEDGFGVDDRTEEALVADAAEPVPLEALEETRAAEPELVVALLEDAVEPTEATDPEAELALLDDEEPCWELEVVSGIQLEYWRLTL